MNQKDLVAFLLDLDWCNKRLDNFTVEMLSTFDFGNEVGLHHQTLIDVDSSGFPEVTLLHDFAIPTGKSMAGINEIRFSAKLGIFDDHCLVSAKIEADFDNEMGPLGSGVHTFYSKQATTESADGARQCLRTYILEMCEFKELPHRFEIRERSR